MKALRCGYAAKGFLSLLGVISVFIELAFERLYHSVAQFLRRYFRSDLRVIVLRIAQAREAQQTKRRQRQKNYDYER
jgi:hypothetical protein